MLNRIFLGKSRVEDVDWWVCLYTGFTFLQNKLDPVTNKPSPGTPLGIYCGTD